MAVFEDEPGDYGGEVPPAPWDFEPELPPEIQQGEDRPVTDPSDYELPPENQGGWERSSGHGGGGDGGGEEPRPSRNGPVYPGERPYPEPPPKRPVQYNPNDWSLSERALQERWIPTYDPGPLPPAYSFWPQQPGIPESMFQQGKGWTPTPQFQETTTFTPGGYAETTTSPSNWMIPRPYQARGPKMTIQPRGGGSPSYYSGPSIPPEVLRQFINLLRYGGIQRI